MNFYGQPLLMRETALRGLMSSNVITGEKKGKKFLPVKSEHGEYTAENMENKCTRVIDSVGIISISGSLFTESSFLQFWFGGVAYGQIRAALEDFKKNTDVRAVLLDINSPGGDTFGCSELAEYTRNYSDTVKPVYTYVGGEAASAGYWLAASTKKIIAHKTAFVGSVGTLVIFEGDTDDIIVTSSLSPDKVPDLANDAGKMQIVKHLDYLTTHFATDVALYRGINKDFVLSDYGRGDIVAAENALKIGMIDLVGNFDNALDLIKTELNGPTSGGYPATGTPAAAKTAGKNLQKLKTRGKNSMAKKKTLSEFVLVDGDAAGELPVVEVTIDVIKEQFPDIAEALIEEGVQKQKATTAEVDEVAADADASNPEEMEAVAEARSGKISAHELTRKLLSAKKKFAANRQPTPEETMRQNRERDNLNMPATGVEGEQKPQNRTASRIGSLRKGDR